jgi:hypothetical protein
LNLRGATVVFDFNGKDLFGTVLTHTRNGYWVIECQKLPNRLRRPDGSRRIILHRSEFVWAWGGPENE